MTPSARVPEAVGFANFFMLISAAPCMHGYLLHPLNKDSRPSKSAPILSRRIGSGTLSSDRSARTNHADSPFPNLNIGVDMQILRAVKVWYTLSFYLAILISTSSFTDSFVCCLQNTKAIGSSFRFGVEMPKL